MNQLMLLKKSLGNQLDNCWIVDLQPAKKKIKAKPEGTIINNGANSAPSLFIQTPIKYGKIIDPEMDEKKIKPVIRALPGLIFTTQANAIENTGPPEAPNKIIAIQQRSVAQSKNSAGIKHKTERSVTKPKLSLSIYFNKTSLIANKDMKNTDNPRDAFEVDQPLANK